MWPFYLWNKGMVQLTDQTTTTQYKWKFCSKKCDMKSVTPCVGKRYGWVDRLNHHKCIWIEILLNKVRHEKCDLLLWEKVWLSWQTKPPLLYINQNFAQKSVTQKVWPFVSSWQPSQLYMKRNFAQKSGTQKMWPLGSSRQTKSSPLYININFPQKSAT